MNDPKHLLEEVDGFQAELLRAGCKDALSEQSASTISAALGVAPPAAASATLGAAATTLSLKSAFVIGGLGAAGALAVWAGVNLLPSAAPNVTTRPPLEVKQSAPALTVQQVEPPATAQAEQASEPPRPKAPARIARPAAGAEPDSLPRELEMIDSARSALARGKASLALSLLDEYAARFPKPHLGAESAVLRIEALIARGQRDRAARLGNELLRREPNGPYARRVRSLLEQSGAR